MPRFTANVENAQVVRPRRRSRARFRVAALLTAAASAVATIAIGSTAAQAVASSTVTTYGVTSTAVQNQTEVGTDAFAWAGKMVTVFQAGRDLRFGAAAMGFAYSGDGGTTWTSGYIPGVTTLTPGVAASDPTWQRVTDVSVTFDDKNQKWVAAAAVQNKAAGGAYMAVVVSTSTNGVNWTSAQAIVTPATVVPMTGLAGLGPDKPWVACNNYATSPSYGSCYVAFSNTATTASVQRNKNVHIVTSADAFSTFGTPVPVSTGGDPTSTTSRYNAQPVPLPDGAVAVVATVGPATGTALRYISHRSSDNGATWGAEVTIGTLTRHSVPAIREFTKPNAESDASGRIYVVGHGCAGAGTCSRSRMNLATSTNGGVSWGAFTALPLASPAPAADAFATADVFASGLAVEPSTSGASARLAVVFYWQPIDATCGNGTGKSPTNCQINVGLSSSANGGSSWSAVTTLNASPAQPGWLAAQQLGTARYASDYLGVGFTTATRATAVFPHAIAPTGTTLNERLYTATVDTSVTPVATVPPLGVSNLTATASAGGTAQATLRFTPPNDGGGVPITGWRVTYRKTLPGPADPSATTVVPDFGGQLTSLVVDNLEPGATYAFTVTPVNAVGAGAVSTTRTVTAVMLPVPNAPATVTATGDIGTITLVWSAVPNPTGNPVTFYDITATPALPGGTVSVAAPGLTTVITGLPAGTTYTLAVAARNGVGTGIATTAEATTFDVPSTPTAVTATASGTTVSVGFTAPEFDGDTPITGYKVFDGVTQVATGSGSPISVANLAPGVHSITVRATNAVGDGPPSSPASVTIGGGGGGTTPPPAGQAAAPGYWMIASDGRVFNFGAAAAHGGVENVVRGLAAAGVTAVDLEPIPGFGGYWIVDSNGTVYAKGTARADLGNAGLSLAQLADGERATAISSTPSGNGYWIFTNRGRAIAKGDAVHRGDMSGTPLNGPVLDSIPTPSGNGYFMVGSDGGIFAFGDAKFFGSMGGQRLNAPVQSLVPTATGLGYWLVASDGGIFAFGDAGFVGSIPGVLKAGQSLNRPITGMVRYGNGYLMVGEDGGIFSFSNQPFLGSLGDSPPDRPIVSVAAQGT